MKIRPVGAEMFDADIRTERQIKMTKLTVSCSQSCEEGD